ncbi:acyl-CoA dehydrogenase family protein [Arthrobacter sp. AZCC_0090]|uniref:acyl-CoA dehydrogenase family protein n=1 Tax=Arthrobacter sp. AZCC_0090 TaxID=2735881 RepID=UPI001612FC88|nr:acyl-CoA dehydrogenase family protein [Arthrobacter sp. AZCC_0090]MBB6407179.1 alkylation response protein AidB-like acyl-CoA dehydrogenase [Arthrobacter sp. AZCC_0090]
MTAQLEDVKTRLELVQKIAPLLDREAEAGAAQGRITDAASEALIGTGILTMSSPAELGGDQAPYQDWLRVIEEVGHADASAAWGVQSLGGHAGAYPSLFPEAGATAIFSGPVPPRIAGMPAPRGRAEKVDGGVIYTGSLQFASGSSWATHFTAGGLLYENDELLMADNGLPRMISITVPREDVRLLGNWDVNGLEASASVDYEIGPLFVSDDFIVSVNPWATKVERGAPYYALSAEILGPMGHTPVVLGLAGRALEEIAALAPKRKRQDGPYPAVGEQPIFLHALVLLDAELNAARLTFYHHAKSLNDYADAGLCPATQDQVNRTKQIARWIHDVGIRCADFAYEWSGSAGLRKGHAIGRIFRNMHAINQHIIVDRSVLLDAAPTVMKDLTASAAKIAQS